MRYGLNEQYYQCFQAMYDGIYSYFVEGEIKFITKNYQTNHNCQHYYKYVMKNQTPFVLSVLYHIDPNITLDRMNGSRSTRTQGPKPVNINISFTINPKNIVNQQTFGLTNHLKNKKIVGATGSSVEKSVGGSKPKTPDLVNTERVELMGRDSVFGGEDKREKKSRKRNSVDQSYLNEYNHREQAEKSINLNKQGDSLHIRKSSTKSKKQSETSTKRKHNRTVSKISAIETFGIKGPVLGATTIIDQRNRNLKNLINRLMTNQLSKKSLPLELPTQQNKTARKKKINRKKQLRQGKSQYLIRRHERQQDEGAINRKMIIEKLTSLRSMNNSIFRSEEDQQLRPRERRTIVINTDHSIDCIDEIHEMERAASGKKSYGSVHISEKQKEKANETKKLINNFLAIHQEYLQEEPEDLQMPIEEQFDVFRREHERIMQKQSKNHHKEAQKKSPSQENKQKNVEIRQSRQRSDDRNHLRPFCSSEMTKQQKMINEIERVKLNQLKKHEVEKWGELLNFIKKSMSEGKADHDEILTNIYQFLEQTKIDLQKEVSKDHPKDNLEEFTNKFQSSQMGNNKKQEKSEIEAQIQQGIEKSFNEISSMSYKDEDYEEENEELKLMNLQMIQNALKSRHENLLQKRNREISSLEEQRNLGKLTEADFLAQKQKIQKWTKKQTAQIMQARKNIWKGYNQAKGIIEKSLKSKHFQEQSAKKKSMMKCLSQNYLLKNYNYKKLLKPQQDQSQQQERSEESFHNQSVQKSKQQKSKESSPKQKSDHKEEENLQNSNVSSSKQSDRSPVSETREDKNIQNEFKDLGQEQDMNVLKEKLLDIKQKRLKEDEPDSEQDKINQNSEDISYEQVDNELQQSISDTEMKLISQQLGKESKLPPPREDYEKLKHMLPEDREDIFEFLFLDLVIELYQEPCQDNRFMKAINSYVDYMKRQANKKRGVKTNLNIVKQYLKRFLGFILRAHRNVLKTLDEPVGPTAIQMLRYMHENDDQPAQCEQTPSPLVIPTSVFDLFEKSLLPSIEFEVYYENDQEKENKRVEFLKNIMHIHNKALFDAMNEYLDLLRPFGIWGKPFPWKNSSSFLHIVSEQQKQQKLKKSTQKVAEYCSYVCGLLVDKQQSLVGNTRLSQDYIQQIKQDRLSRMLATQLMQNEQRWLFYDDQETQVLVEISNAVYLIMLREATHEAHEIVKKKNAIMIDMEE